MVRSIIYFVTFYIVTALYLVLGSWLLLGPRRWAMEGLRIHGLTCVWLLKVIVGTRFELRGAEKIPPRPYLVVSKHQSAWDTFGLIPVFHDPAMVMKAELGWIPFYGWFSHKFEHIFVKRDKAAAALKALIRDGRQRATQGREIVIFPEGTRRAPGAPPDYKSGYIALYEGLGLPAVPVALNSGIFWPRRSYRRYAGTIVVEILEPVPAGMKRTEARRIIEERIEAACAALNREAAAAPNAPPTALEAIAAPQGGAGAD